MAEDDRQIHIQWQKMSFFLCYDETTTVSCIRKEVKIKTNVLEKNQKLMGLRVKGKPAPDDALLIDLKLKKKQKVMLMGTAEEEIVVEPPKIDVEIIDDFKEGIDFFEVDLEKNPIYLEKVKRRIFETEPKMLNDPREGKPLLVLDIDYTIYDCGTTVEVPEEQMRPNLHEFLAESYKHYDIAIWSATSMKWIDLKLKEMNLLKQPDYKITFCLDSSAMITANSERYGVFVCKPLAVVWENEKLGKFYTKEKTIMFDDLKRNFCMNPTNGLKIKPWKIKYLENEDELRGLAKYLRAIKDIDDFNTLDHDDWKKNLSSLRKEEKKRKRDKEGNE